MWTAKRLLILVIGLLVSMSSFAVYSLVLGGIDGLPPLPIGWLPTTIGQPHPLFTEGETDRRIKAAFGNGCQELQRPLRFWQPDKGVAIAAGDFVIEPDGRVRLAPFSAALYHKSKAPGTHPEISTIRCDIAFLTLDRPVSSYSELNNRKVIAVEMVGRALGVSITNNRRTAEKNDDIDILISNGPLYYEERKDLIWTEGVVCLTDHQSKPPTVIRGKGLDMMLAKNSGPNAKKNPKAKPANPNSEVGNVEKIRLRADTDMYFWTDPKSGFLGGTPNVKKPLQPAAAGAIPPEKARINIRTGGPFEYDLTRETAYFESPPRREGKNAKGEADLFAPDQVHVQRLQVVNGKEKFDQLTCDRLDLQFRRKVGMNNANPSTGGDKEIETATATRRDGNEVVLSLDTEGMAAFGNHMFFRAGDATSGPMTILKGEPLTTAKDGHKMVCKELHLFGADRFGEGQRALAKGPGQLDMLDEKNADKKVYPTHVLWRDTLTIVKDKEGDQVFDLITVVGEASFIDDQQKQELHGEKIMVWLLKGLESEAKSDAVGGAKQELHRVIAQERVRASSPEFVIPRANSLVMTFAKQIARDAVLPLENEPKIDGPKSVEKKGAVPTGNPTPEKKGPATEKEKDQKPRPPIELTGNEITIAASTLGTKKQLQELIAKGSVHVFQAGEKAGEKRIDIIGTLLTIRKAGKGDIMTVYGEKNKPARLELGDTIVWGPIVTVNQGENRADVEGIGAMEMPSNKNIDGTETAKKNTRITIHWNKNMNFDGKYAMFHGGVQAHENGAYSKVQCQVLTAILDKTVSFKDGQDEKQSAKIDRLVFDKNVYVEDYKFDEKKQPVQYNKLHGWVLINQEDGPTRVTGPGWVRLLAKGNADQGFGPAPAPAAAPKDKPARLEWKLTHVKFNRDMHSNTKGTTKTATFYGDNSGVEVFHFPTVKIDDNMDADKPPKDGLYLRCEILKVEAKQNADRTNQTMIAERNVYFRTDTYVGYSDVLKFDDSTDIVIFEGLNGNRVRLFQFVPGDPNPRPVSLQSTKVLYNRKTGQIDTDGVKSITN